MPQSTENIHIEQSTWGTFSRPLAITSLGLIALASFFIVYRHLDSMQPARVPQAAAVAASVDYFQDIRIGATAAFVMDVTTGEVLYEKNSDAQLPLASITKVPLAIVVAETMPPDTTITIPYDTDPEWGGQRLIRGERWKTREIIDFTLVSSSNAGAEILSQGAEDAVRAKYPLAPLSNAVLWRMNNLATELDLKNTYFLNVSGLDESTTQSGSYGSARDVAKIFSYAVKTYPDVFARTADDGFLVMSESGDRLTAHNTNEALGVIPGLIMGKTGYTDLAGGNLAVVFDVGLAHPVVAVVLGSTREGRFSDIKKLVATARTSVMNK